MQQVAAAACSLAVGFSGAGMGSRYGSYDSLLIEDSLD